MPAFIAGIHNHRLGEKAPAVVMDCGNKSGNDRQGGHGFALLVALQRGAVSLGGFMILRRLVIFAALAGLLASCGIRGPLEPPPTAKQDQHKKPEQPKKNSSFILDSIL